MSEPYFVTTSGGLAPNPHAHAPWGEDMLHGRLLGALAARALEEGRGGPGRRIARLTVDLFRPAAMAPVQVEVRTVRSGRKLEVADALLRCDGHDVGRATAVFLAESEDPPGHIWRPEPEPWPDPDTVDPPDGPAHAAELWELRVVEGGFGTGERSRLWTNETGRLVDDEPLSPVVRAALSGDLACPLANSGDAGLFYINADYTMLLGRYPVGEWIGIGVERQLQADGISVGSAVLVDREGPFATSGGTSVARPPLEGP